MSAAPGVLSPGRVAEFLLRAARYRGLAPASELVALLESHERLRALAEGRPCPEGPAQVVAIEPPGKARLEEFTRVLEAPSPPASGSRLSPLARDGRRWPRCAVCQEPGHYRNSCPRVNDPGPSVMRSREKKREYQRERRARAAAR